GRGTHAALATVIPRRRLGIRHTPAPPRAHLRRPNPARAAVNTTSNNIAAPPATPGCIANTITHDLRLTPRGQTPTHANPRRPPPQHTREPHQQAHVRPRLPEATS
ncbi:hypothetical protein, partial [Mycobacterium simiae]|uniref:hypothetical protein n=1 Tax=Mycobacterium simiae TaxID=1784 RepID=UPI001CB70977